MQRLGHTARAWRVALVVVLGGFYVLGSLVGDDHWWPFGPWRMYSTSSAPSGTVKVFALEVTTADRPAEADWQRTALSLRNIGLNRAEVEGRAELMTARPEVLATLAEAHARLHPDDEPWTGVRLLRRSTVLEDRSPTGEVREQVLVEWTEAGGGRLVAERGAL